MAMEITSESLAGAQPESEPGAYKEAHWQRCLSFQVASRARGRDFA